MRIDFFHVNLLKDTTKLKKVNTVDADCSTATQYNNYNPKADKSKRDSFNYSKDYLDIKKLLDLEESKDEDTFLSDEDFSKLKNNIKNDDYKINSKALSMSLIKYIERS